MKTLRKFSSFILIIILINFRFSSLKCLHLVKSTNKNTDWTYIHLWNKTLTDTARIVGQMLALYHVISWIFITWLQPTTFTVELKLSLTRYSKTVILASVKNYFQRFFQNALQFIDQNGNHGLADFMNRFFAQWMSVLLVYLIVPKMPNVLI